MALQTSAGEPKLDTKDHESDHNDVQKDMSVDVADGEMQQEEDPALEKRVLRKLDGNLITLFCLLYLMSFLGQYLHTPSCSNTGPLTLRIDRASIGNAALTTFTDDLNLEGNEYGAAVSVFYSTYIFFEPAWAVLLKILTPKYLMTSSTLAWAAVTVGTAFITNFSQLATMRVLLGIAEAAIIPCITMYITMVYNRNEYAVRKSYIQVSSAVSGAFGGLMAYGLTQINSGALKGWQWMYLVEGILSFILVPVTFLWLPNAVASATWLNAEEKAFMARRHYRNRGVYDESEKFRWSEIVRTLKDWKVYVQACAHFGTNTTLYSVTTFMPRIIAGLGFTTRVNSQLLTVPVYFTAGLSFYLLARMADRRKQTSTFMMIALSFNAVGYILLLAISHPGGRFFGLFVLSLGMYAAASLNIVWCTTMHAGYFKRAFASGLVQLVGNASGAVIGFIFTTESGPRYMMGMYTALGLTVMSMCCAILLTVMLRRENARRRELVAQGAADQPELGDMNPHFMYFP